MKVVSEESIDKAIGSAIELISHLKKIRSSRRMGGDSIQDFYNILAERIENGEKFENIVNEIDCSILVTLVSRGHNTSEKLATVLGKQHSAMRQILHTRKIRLRNLKE